MAQSNVLKRFLDAGMSFTEMTQSKAEALVKELVKAGEVQTEQAQALVTDLVERSRRSTEALIEQVRSEIDRSGVPTATWSSSCTVAPPAAHRSRPRP